MIFSTLLESRSCNAVSKGEDTIMSGRRPPTLSLFGSSGRRPQRPLCIKIDDDKSYLMHFHWPYFHCSLTKFVHVICIAHDESSSRSPNHPFCPGSVSSSVAIHCNRSPSVPIYTYSSFYITSRHHPMAS